MRYSVKAPSPLLAQFVDRYWSFEGFSTSHAVEHCLPTATTELVFSLTGGRAEIVGPASRFFLLETAGQFAVAGVHFKAGGSFPFLRCPAGEVANRRLTLEDFWGAEARRVEERVYEAKTPDARFAVIEAALLNAAKGALTRHPAVSFALRAFEEMPFAVPLGEVAAHAGMSSRRFIEVFKNEVGITPKLFCRVQRFQAVVDHVQPLADVDWAGIAAHCGYFDQPHFIRDFREFSGFSPTAYLRCKGEHKNHVPLN